MLPYVYLEIVILFLGLSCAVQDVEWQSVGVKTSGLQQDGRQNRAWSPMQRGWKSLLKGTRIVKNDATITLYRKHGSYDQALKEFKSLNPSNVQKGPDGSRLGRVGDTGVILRGKVAGENDPDGFEALLLIPSKNAAALMGIPSKSRKVKAIQYFSHEK